MKNALYKILGLFFAVFGVFSIVAPELFAQTVGDIGIALATAPVAVAATTDPAQPVQESEYERLADIITRKIVAAAPAQPAQPIDVRVVKDSADDKGAVAVETLRLMRAIMEPEYASDAHEAAYNLVRNGRFGSEAQRSISGIVSPEAFRTALNIHVAKRAAGDWYSTIVDADGKYLLPTVVRDQIDRVAKQYGAIRRVSDVWTGGLNQVTRVPSSTGDITLAAVEEGAAITSRKRAFGRVDLRPKKWARITPWTYEAEVALAVKILEDIQFNLGYSFARAEDDASINGDGTSTYNSITGIINGASVEEKVIAGADFDDITPDELILAKNELAVGFRTNLAYMFHPDMEAVFLTKKDNQGAYIFDYQTVRDVPTLKGIPVLYTEALPALSATALDTVFGILGNFRFWKLLLGPGPSMEMMNTGNITDADTGTAVNLNTQDIRAMKVRHFFDAGTNFTDGFCVIKTAAST